MDLSVNSIAPLWHAALLTECGRIEPRARALILLVRRWSKDRALCHVSKGHLSPPAWSLLAIYFLQVGVTGEGALLPSLDGFEMASQIVSADSQCAGSVPEPLPARWLRTRAGGPKKSVAELFREFFIFYHTLFDWRGEAVSIRAARRAAPGLRLPLHVLVKENGDTEMGPSIEDPFDCARNLGATTSSPSFIRLSHEIARAATMCGNGESLTELLVPWAPPEGMDVEETQMMPQPDRNNDQPLVREEARQAQMARDVQLSGGPLAWLGSPQEDQDDFQHLHPAHEAALFHLYPDKSRDRYRDPADHYQYQSPIATSGFQYQ